MDVSARNGEIFVIEEVVRELERKDDDIHKWVRDRDAMIVVIDADIQTHLATIMSKYLRLLTLRRIDQAVTLG